MRELRYCAKSFVERDTGVLAAIGLGELDSDERNSMIDAGICPRSQWPIRP